MMPQLLVVEAVTVVLHQPALARPLASRRVLAALARVAPRRRGSMLRRRTQEGELRGCPERNRVDSTLVWSGQNTPRRRLVQARNMPVRELAIRPLIPGGENPDAGRDNKGRRAIRRGVPIPVPACRRTPQQTACGGGRGSAPCIWGNGQTANCQRMHRPAWR